jgi:hypothetical protein
MMPASFAIPYLLTAPLPPSIAVVVVPAAEQTACQPAPDPCFATVSIVARNRSNRPLLLDDLHVSLSSERRGSFEQPYDPPLPIPPFGEVTLPDRFAFHVTAGHGVLVLFHGTGERPRSRGSAHSTSGVPWGQLRHPAAAACVRCGGRVQDCWCETRDRGRLCTEVSQCQGICLFDRFEKLPEPACTPTALTRCPTVPATGFRVGHCSDLKTPLGCPNVLTERDSAARPIALPNAQIRQCFQEVKRIQPDATGSSPRR